MGCSVRKRDCTNTGRIGTRALDEVGNSPSETASLTCTWTGEYESRANGGAHSLPLLGKELYAHHGMRRDTALEGHGWVCPKETLREAKSGRCTRTGPVPPRLCSLPRRLQFRKGVHKSSITAAASALTRSGTIRSRRGCCVRLNVAISLTLPQGRSLSQDDLGPDLDRLAAAALLRQADERQEGVGLGGGHPVDHPRDPS